MKSSTSLRLRRLRLLTQLLLLIVATLIVAHGLFGPQIAPRNLATVLTWVHYRGLLIGGLLAIGNVFCFGCPMVLVRDTARRALHPGWRWPRLLRTKWLAAALVVAVLFTYELFDLWALPRATAWLVVGYFAAAVAIDVLFAGASFCKYVCPVGQFNFIASTMSPTELKVKSIATCRQCRTVDCIKGRRDPVFPLQIRQRGCELGLFQASKVGNLDCTLCLDCVAACPHENIGLAWRVPGDELIDASRRSSIGRLGRRRDIAALATVFTFGALLNAFAMTRPVYDLERWLAASLPSAGEWLPLAILFAMGLIATPIVMLGATASTSRALAPTRATISAVATHYAYALVPFGTGVWLAHYGFHLLTGALTVVPVAQSAALDAAGWPALGEPMWQWAGLMPGSVFPFQLGCVLLGALGSLGLSWRIAERDGTNPRAAVVAPACLVLLLAAAALWILVQPMEMRGLAG